MTESGLHGTIPTSIGNLTNLKSLRLHSVHRFTGNRFSSHLLDTSIPSSIANLTKLETFDLQPGTLQGTFPSPWPKLTNLQHFSLISSESQLLEIYGFLPNFWQDHPTLKSLVVANTALIGITGQNASEMRPLPALETLHLAHNPLMQLRTSLFDTPSLKTVELSSNPYLLGTLHFLNRNLSSLEKVNISETQLTGKLADTFWQRRNLSIIWLDLPLLSGSIPSSIGNLTNLTDLYISSPYFHGSIPREIGLCKQLRRIQLLNAPFSAPLPLTIGTLDKLEVLYISKAKNLGSLPDTIGHMSALVDLRLRSCGLNGTIPSSLDSSSHPNLEYLDLSDNSLEGEIPDMSCTTCILSRNFLTGKVPPGMGSNADLLLLDNNHLGPDMDADTFSRNRSSSLRLDVSHNKFRCPLPENLHWEDTPDPFAPSSQLRFSHNRFFGSIPGSATHISELYLDHNELSGDLIDYFRRMNQDTLDLTHNNFTGTLPSMRHTSLKKAHFDENGFSGTLPLPSPEAIVLTLSQNQFNAPLSLEFIRVVQHLKVITELDLSFNQIECPLDTGLHPVELINSTLKLLNLRNNSFDCLFHPDNINFFHASHLPSSPPLVYLDLSHNSFKGPFTLSPFSYLSVLDLSHNHFTGDFLLNDARFPSLAQLDMTSNGFSLNVASIADMPYLHSLLASQNYFKGFLAPVNVPNLETINLDSNLLDEQPSLVALGDLFLKHSLKILSIAFNPLIPPFASFDTNVTGLDRTQLSFPSSTQKGVVCFTISFFNSTTSNFLFDEGLFSWTQCDCDGKHFGLPPDRCHSCPTASAPHSDKILGVTSCGGKSMVIAKNSYVFIPNQPNWAASRRSQRNDDTYNHTITPTSDPTYLQFETESCLVLPEQELMHKSGCGGITLTADELTPSSNAISHLHLQCSPGASGRLCSRCECDVQYEVDCYYEKALQCVKCKRVFSSSESLGLFFGMLILVIIIGTIGMLLILRNRRVQKTVPWKNLSKLKKTFHRFMYLSSLGHISILITFVQMFVELTHWDAYATVNVLQLMNLDSEGLGLRCFFPILAQPNPDLWIRLSVPFAAVTIVFICVVLAEILSRILTRFNYRHAARRALNHGSSANVQSDHEYSPISTLSDSMDNGNEWISRHGSISDFGSINSNSSDIWTPVAELDSYPSITVHYPTLALITSVSITAIKFFYFGTALTSHTYFFSEVQAYTNFSYVQNLPWIKTDHALNEQWSAIPMVRYFPLFILPSSNSVTKYSNILLDPMVFISFPTYLLQAIIFDLILPVAFIILCYRVRNSFSTPSVAIYVGNLFESFTAKCYWWEIVNIFKKLSVALALRAFPASDALQTMTIISIIAGLQVVQVSLTPWKRRAENVMDSISAVLLISALVAARNGDLTHSYASAYTVLVVAAIYVLVSIGLIVHETLTGKTDYEKRYDKWSELQSGSVLDREESMDGPSDTAGASATMSDSDGD